jgi:3-hydroxyacyl-[acyl-carrier-protein] dehydratase
MTGVTAVAIYSVKIYHGAVFGKAAIAAGCGTRLTELPVLSKQEIEAVLPHRDPFLLLDEVVELQPGERVVARKQVRPDEWYLAGHFPGRPIMPGVLIVEAMAQAGAVAVLSEEANRGKLALFAGIDGVRFKRIVEPGDELELTCDLERVRGPVGRGKATAKVDGELAARGTLTFAVEQ